MSEPRYVGEYRVAFDATELLEEADAVLAETCGNCGARRGAFAGHVSMLDAISCESTR